MIAGHGTPDQAPARLLRLSQRALFQRLVDRLAEASAEYLLRQIAAGAEQCRCSIPGPACCRRRNSNAGAFNRSPAWRRASGRRRREIPIIAFPRGAATQVAKIAKIEGLACIGLDTAVEPRVAAATLPARLALQGNLDPLALIVGGRPLDESVERVLAGFDGRAHVFNLGHGILPETPIPHVEQLVARVRRS